MFRFYDDHGGAHDDRDDGDVYESYDSSYAHERYSDLLTPTAQVLFVAIEPTKETWCVQQAWPLALA